MSTIRTMTDLYTHFGSEPSFRSLNRRIYKDTACGAHISVYGTVSGRPVAFHNGHTDPIPEDFVLMTFVVGSIVEGSEAHVDSPLFEAGRCTGERLDRGVADMEAEVDRLWREANDD